MQLPPRWKVIRELKRIQRQFDQVPWFAWSPFSKMLHDATKRWKIRVSDGQKARQSHIAVFLIFQPNGLKESLVHTLKHLNDNGYSVFLVANHSLDQDALDVLAPHCWKVMQRPNYGYDFGGYRDAILHLASDDVLPDSLLVMNDSMWFPLFDDCTLLDRFKAQTTDLFGFVLSEYKHRKNPEPHIQSYMFSFRKEAMQRPEFRKYWRGMTVSSNKQMVIRRCEKKMTMDLNAAGFSFGSVHTFEDVTKAIAELPDDQLEYLVRYQAEIGTRNASQLIEHVENKDQDPKWADKIRSFLDTETFGKYLLLAHPNVLIGRLRVPMLKKDRLFNYQVQRRALLESEHRAEISPVILDEISNWDT
ncbi:MAG: rhamnan synthesis F family protein [Paracoccaceae bacterium]